ncbi:MAG: hypothetical protein VKN72_10185 [Nostocales cyanobacterium 94392]|nr:hypothetical protein [Nostocales cyanobacterium 94392]
MKAEVRGQMAEGAKAYLISQNHVGKILSLVSLWQYIYQNTAVF